MVQFKPDIATVQSRCDQCSCSCAHKGIKYNVTFPASGQFGLTACNVELVKLKFFKTSDTGKTKVTIPTFEALHPLHAFPLSEMIRILTDESAMETFEELAEMVKLPIIYYSKEDIDEA